MSHPRRYHTATLLPDGRVLVVGGEDYDGLNTPVVLSSAEIYDPVSGNWRETDSMSTARKDHTATLLPDGSVLIIGGRDSSSAHATTEIFDPISEEWTPAASLGTARSNHTASLSIQETVGRVMVIGGLTTAFNSAGPREIYNPATDSWEPAAGSALFGHTAMVRNNSLVMLTGGKTDATTYYDNLLTINGITGSFINLLVYLNQDRMNHTATSLPDGKMLVVGGFYDGNSLNSVEIFNFNTNTWANAASLGTARTNHTATLLPDGRVLIVGGYNATGGIPATELYVSASNIWTSGGALNDARSGHTTTLLADGRLLVVGGWNSASGATLASCEMRGYSVPSWSASTDMDTTRSNHAATLLPDGRVLLAGGNNASGTYLRTAAVYVPDTNSWATLVGQMVAFRAYHTQTLLPDGTVLAAGGRNGTDSLNTVEVFLPGPQIWQTTGNMTAARYQHTATLLSDGRVLVSGGTFQATIPDYYSSAEVYDPIIGQWSATSSMSEVRTRHTATLLANGKVLIAGGYKGGTTTSSYSNKADLFDPANNTFSPTGSFTTGRANHTATLLPDGRVLIAGGFSRDITGTIFLSSCRLYNPNTGTWSSASSLPFGRANHTATLLADGRVLITGGSDMDGAIGVNVVYDPASDTWVTVPSLTHMRYNHTATLLPSGRLFVAGGQTTSAMAKTEQYDRGLGQVSDWRPTITTATSPLLNGTSLNITGTGFRGIAEGSGSNSSQHSPSNYPLVQIYRLDNGQTHWLHPSSGSFGNIYYDSLPFTGFNGGHALLTVFANGIPSYSRVILLQSGPGPFNKTSPSNDAADQTTSLTLSWGSSVGATSFEYCYDTTDDDACTSWVSNGTSTSKALNGLNANTSYYWHVRAINNEGTTYANGSSTAFWRFTTAADPVVNPTLDFYLPLIRR